MQGFYFIPVDGQKLDDKTIWVNTQLHSRADAFSYYSRKYPNVTGLVLSHAQFKRFLKEG
jgi:hypothetical protein